MRTWGVWAAAAAAATAALATGACSSAADGADDAPVPYVAHPDPSGPDVFGKQDHYAPVEPVLEAVPNSVAVGDTLRFVVALENPTGKPIRLTPCPTFYAAWGEDDVVVSHKGRLHCESAPAAIPAKGRIRFEMKLKIVPQRYLRPGYPGRVFWRLTSAPEGNWDQSDTVPAK